MMTQRSKSSLFNRISGQFFSQGQSAVRPWRNIVSMHFHLFTAVLLVIASAQPARSVDYHTEKDLVYVSPAEKDSYRTSQCRMDFYYPEGLKDFPTLVWFHGGGLTGGTKAVPEELKKQGFAIIAATYRLSPKVKAPAYIEDAAAAVAWAWANIEKYGGSKKKIFVGGHSAGAYLASMIGLEKKWLARYGIDPDELAGLLPMSGQMITHYTIRQEAGIADTRPVIDQYAPLFHVHQDAPPMLLITGDRELEMLGRYEENAYMNRMMKLVKHEKTTFYELEGYNHGGMIKGAYPLMIKFMKETLATQSAAKPAKKAG